MRKFSFHIFVICILSYCTSGSLFAQNSLSTFIDASGWYAEVTGTSGERFVGSQVSSPYLNWYAFVAYENGLASNGTMGPNISTAPILAGSYGGTFNDVSVWNMAFFMTEEVLLYIRDTRQGYSNTYYYIRLPLESLGILSVDYGRTVENWLDSDVYKVSFINPDADSLALLYATGGAGTGGGNGGNGGNGTNTCTCGACCSCWCICGKWSATICDGSCREASTGCTACCACRCTCGTCSHPPCAGKCPHHPEINFIDTGQPCSCHCGDGVFCSEVPVVVNCTCGSGCPCHCSSGSDQGCDCGACCMCRCTCGKWWETDGVVGCRAQCSHECSVCSTGGSHQFPESTCCDCHCSGGGGHGGGDGDGDGDGDGGGDGDGDGDGDEDGPGGGGSYPKPPSIPDPPSVPPRPVFEPPPYEFPSGGVKVPEWVYQCFDDIRNNFVERLGLNSFLEKMHPNTDCKIGAICISNPFADIFGLELPEWKACLDFDELAKQGWVKPMRMFLTFLISVLFVSAIFVVLRTY